jgi:hypothetical protein
LNSKAISFLPFILLFFIVTGIAGGYMDVWWHVMNLVETFYTIPHLIIYLSVFLGGMSTLFVVVWQLRKVGSFTPGKIPNVRGLALAGTGSLIELVAGVSDNLYHSAFGFDVTLWSPPHLLVIFGGVVNALGVAELFLKSPFPRARRIGPIIAYGIAVSFFQFAMTEYDINNSWAIGVRWQHYTEYYPILIIPILSFVITLGIKRLGKPVATLIMIIPFLFKLAAYGAWSITPAHMFFPLMIIIGAILFDLIFILTRRMTRFAVYLGVFGMSLGVVAVVALQSPLGMDAESFLLSFLGSVIVGLVFSVFAELVSAKEVAHA